LKEIIMSSALSSVLGGGNILSSVMSLAGVAFPPLGIATSLANLVTQGVGQAVTQAAQQLTKEAGMPKFIGDMIGNIVKDIVGKLQHPSDPSCDNRTKGDSGVNQTMQDLIQGMVKDLVEKAKEEMQGQHKKAGGSGGKHGGGSWLEALSRAMGEVAGDKAAKMVELSNKITGLAGDDSPEAAKEMTAVTQELNGTSKLFSMLQDAFNNVVKSIGDGLSTAARK
jgi:predicted secreted Zn-dependent protease